MVFCFGHTPCHAEYLFPDQGPNTCPLQWKHETLTTELPGNSQEYAVLINTAQVFSEVLIPVYIPTTRLRVPRDLYPCQPLVFFVFVFHFSHAGGFRNFIVKRVENLVFGLLIVFNLLDTTFSDLNSSMCLLFKKIENALKNEIYTIPSLFTLDYLLSFFPSPPKLKFCLI